MRTAAAVLIALLAFAGCGSSLTTPLSAPPASPMATASVRPAPSSTSSGAPTPPAPIASARAVDSGSRFELDFRVPRTDWTTTDSITGEATLSLLGSGSVTISGSEFILFEFDEIDGSTRVVPASEGVCTTRDLDAENPITLPLTKSGAWGPADPNVAFLQSFFANPQIHLPAGDWTITAIASFMESGACSGPDQTLRASVVVRVTA